MGNEDRGHEWDCGLKVCLNKTSKLWPREGNNALLDLVKGYKAVVVEQLAKWLLPTPEGLSSKPEVSHRQIYLEHLLNVEKTKMKKYNPGIARFKKIIGSGCVVQICIRNYLWLFLPELYLKKGIKMIIIKHIWRKSRVNNKNGPFEMQ